MNLRLVLMSLVAAGLAGWLAYDRLTPSPDDQTTPAAISAATPAKVNALNPLAILPPDSFDKDFLRRWVAARCDPYRDPIPAIPRDIIAEAARIYVSVFETITGEGFAVAQPDTPVLERIRANLRRFF